MNADEIQRKLEELTPGGSEFYDDPEACFNYVERKLDSIINITQSEINRIRAKSNDDFINTCNALYLIMNNRKELLENEIEKRKKLEKALKNLIDETEIYRNSNPTTYSNRHLSSKALKEAKEILKEINNEI